MLKRIALIGAAVVVLVIAVTFIITLISRDSNDEGSDLQVFGNSLFSIQYPRNYTVISNDFASVQFRPIGNEGEVDSNSAELIAVSRVGPKDAVPGPEELHDTLSANGFSVEQSEKGGVETITATQDSDQTTVYDYYIYAEVFVWRLSFESAKNSKIETMMSTIVESFNTTDSFIIETLRSTPSSSRGGDQRSNE